MGNAGLISSTVVLSTNKPAACSNFACMSAHAAAYVCTEVPTRKLACGHLGCRQVLPAHIFVTFNHVPRCIHVRQVLGGSCMARTDRSTVLSTSIEIFSRYVAIYLFTVQLLYEAFCSWTMTISGSTLEANACMAALHQAPSRHGACIGVHCSLHVVEIRFLRLKQHKPGQHKFCRP